RVEIADLRPFEGHDPAQLPGADGPCPTGSDGDGDLLRERPAVRVAEAAVERTIDGDSARVFLVVVEPGWHRVSSRRYYTARARIRAHPRRWRPRPHARRTESTPSRADFGRRLADGPFSTLWPAVLRQTPEISEVTRFMNASHTDFDPVTLEILWSRLI